LLVAHESVIDLIIMVNSLGFRDEKVERAIIYGGASSVEEILYFLVADSEGYWEHQFMSESDIPQQ
jgi:hypothetical protein